MFEGLSLQYGDLTLELNGPEPYHFPFFEVKLEERKNWQKQAGYDGPRTGVYCTLSFLSSACLNHCLPIGGVYQIYKQDIEEMDVYTHLPRWLKYLESCLGRSLELDDYIFPYVSQNGTVDPKRTMSYDVFQKLLTKFTAGAGLIKVYTTHCFRRGGAQYRFMYAPIGHRWSLSVIRWWGGWAKGEQVSLTVRYDCSSLTCLDKVDTMIKYLVDSLQSYETGHGDALCPIPTKADKSFMGEHVNLAPPSTEEIRQWKLSMDRSLGNVVSKIVGQVTAAFAGTQLSQSPSPDPDTAAPSPSNSVVSLQERTVCHSRDRPSSMPYPANAPSRAQSVSASSSDTDGSATTQSPGTNLPPIPGVVIRDVKNWRDVIQQWDVGDTGMVVLKDWPKEWYQGSMKKYTGSLYSQRKKIAEEYEQCVLHLHILSGNRGFAKVSPC